jgi:predicted GTPase/uncharacterized protein (DUF697 family)
MSETTDPGLMSALIDKLREARRMYETTQVRCGITGIAGSGKSSLINAIAGEKIARVNVVEQTMEAQEHHHGGMTFVDLPGCGTQKWPKDTYVQKLGLATYDCFILVTSTRFYENDAYLYNQLATVLRKSCFIVRNKFDEAVENNRIDNDSTEEQTRQVIEENIADNFKPDHPPKVYLTSARHPGKYDLPVLVESIIGSLTDMKRVRATADVAAWSGGVFKEKRSVAERVVSIYAGLSAANALNPIPGLDISVDLQLLNTLSEQVLHIYGLTAKQSEYMLKFLDSGKASVQALKQMTGRIGAKYATERGISILLKVIVSGELFKSLSKYIPLVGTLISAGLGYKRTYSYGEQLIDDCEAVAKEVLREFNPSQDA